jgi:hypothetical protein
MTELLFEKFWLMLGLGIIVSGSVIAWANQRRTPRLVKAAKIVPVVFALLLLMNWWVITDREAIRMQIKKLVAACEKGDADAMGKLFDKQFSAQGLTREDLVTEVKKVFENLRIANVWLLDVQIDVNRQTPTAKLATTASIVSQANHDYGSVRSDWELEFIRRDEKGWLVYTLRPLSVMLNPVNDIRDVIRSARWVN